MKAIEFTEGEVDSCCEFTVKKNIDTLGFWGAVDRWSNRMNIDEVRVLNAREMFNILKSGKALMNEEIIMTFKYGGPLVDGRNISLSQLEQFVGEFAILS